MEIVIQKAARKALLKMPKQMSARFMEAFYRIAEENGENLDIKRLQNRDGYRLRIGTYRAIFNKNYELLDIINIGSRGEIYK